MRLALLVFLATTAAGDYCRESLTGVYCRDSEGRVFRSAAARPPLSYQSGGSATALLNARIFDPNPVAAINDPSLMDNNDSPSAVPGHAYENASVDLLGPHARIVDLQAPHTIQPDPLGPLMFDRGDDRFEPVNACFHVDRTQRHLQSLGYTGTRQLVAYPIEIDALALNGADASQFLPSMRIGRGTLFFGSGGTDDAEDADLVVHEYGHAILEWIAPGTFAGSLGSEARALSEGFGDYLAFSAHYEKRVASGRDPFCLADWDARCWTDAASENCAYPPGSDCLRRLDSPNTMADYQRTDSAGVEHRNGQIWSSALRQLYLLLGRRVTDTLVIESVFSVPPRPTFAVMATRLIETDRLLYNGQNIPAICAVMNARGIGVSCDGTPRGELTHVQTGERNVFIPDIDPAGARSRITVSDPRPIESLAVRVDIEHPSRGDLRIELHAPDGTRVILLQPSTELTADIHATFGVNVVPAESLDKLRGMIAAGQWTLSIVDVRSRDAGTLQSWSLVFRFAGDEPQSTRPRGAKTQMIPVVAHVFGANVTPYASDVRVANVTATPQTATLILTRSRHDGTDDFSAVNVAIAPGATVAFDDVVQSLFRTNGSGSLEVLGDVLVTSRLYTIPANGGKVGQEIPANLESGPQLTVTPPVEPGRRYNLGITEIAGVRTEVRFGATTLTVEPFSHVQLPNVTGATIETAGTIVAYISEIDSASGDLTFFPAQQAPAQGIIPAIGATGADGTRWRTDVFIPELVRDAVEGVGELFVESRTSFGGARIGNGRTSQFVPLREADERTTQHLIGIDNDGEHRANIGIVSDRGAVAEVVVYDAAGAVVDTFRLEAPLGFAQTGVRATVTGGRADVRHLEGDRFRAYASVIDRRSGDPAFIDGQ